MISKVLGLYGQKVLSQALKSTNALCFYAFSQMESLEFPQFLSLLQLVGQEYEKGNHINGINKYMLSFHQQDG